MMGRYGTREAELDDLLRREVFVDLYKVVRGGLRISRPGYGLKEVEHLLDFERTPTIKDGGTSIVEFERWMIERDDAILDEIAAYNREDCIATRVLARLAARAARRGARGVRAVPAPGAGRVEARQAREGRAGRAARGAARRPATRPQALAHSSSTTTTASASPSGGRCSTRPT